MEGKAGPHTEPTDQDGGEAAEEAMGWSRTDWLLYGLFLLVLFLIGDRLARLWLSS